MSLAKRATITRSVMTTISGLRHLPPVFVGLRSGFLQAGTRFCRLLLGAFLLAGFTREIGSVRACNDDKYRKRADEDTPPAAELLGHLRRDDIRIEFGLYGTLFGGAFRFS